MNTPNSQPRFSDEEVLSWLRPQPKRISTAALILETTDERALIVKTAYKPYWTFPGGIVDENETPLQAVVREMKEEVGIRVAPDEITFVAIVSRLGSSLHTYQFLFTAKLSEEMLAGVTLDQREVNQFELVSRADVAAAKRVYGKAIKLWADHRTGYIEQVFEKDG